jgi:7,8-didemethyl-8-hydroxy-5-deazariboflavin synthase
MVVGYSLGNRNDKENDIGILQEDNENIITYSKALPIILSKICRNECAYCGFRKKDTLTVPYSIIRNTKNARSNGIREALFIAGERIDQYPHIRSLLDLWGFNSYMDYVYAVSELAFLEGLIPVVDIGFLTPDEIKRIQEIAALLKVMLDTVDESLISETQAQAEKKKIEYRKKNLEWAGKLKMPVITGILVGVGETKKQREQLLSYIAGIHKKYGMVHEVLIQNFIPAPGTPLEKLKPPKKETMISTVKLAKSILPDDIRITVPIDLNPDIEDFIKAGVNDLGRIMEGSPLGYYKQEPLNFEELVQKLNNMGYTVQQRFPLSKAFIKAGKYSKKLGQVFDSYSYKIKKEEQERVKEAKLNNTN